MLRRAFARGRQRGIVDTSQEQFEYCGVGGIGDIIAIRQRGALLNYFFFIDKDQACQISEAQTLGLPLPIFPNTSIPQAYF